MTAKSFLLLFAFVLVWAALSIPLIPAIVAIPKLGLRNFSLVLYLLVSVMGFAWSFTRYGGLK